MQSITCTSCGGGAIAESPGQGLATALARASACAAERDRTGADLSDEVRWLHEAGTLWDALPEGLSGAAGWSDAPTTVAETLRQVGRASLPLARLVEGHVNAAQLIDVYATDAVKARTCALVREGGLLGVWGAEAAAPVRAEPAAEGWRLSGSKTFCSGLGPVRLALVSAAVEGGVGLFAVEVDDPARADPDQWRVSGMRATTSGGYDLAGVTLGADAMLGSVGDYYAEPYFLGGMYRICAVQLGGAEALLDALAARLSKIGKANDPLSQHRVGRGAAWVRAIEAITARIAAAVAHGAPADVIADEAVLAREGVERCATALLEIVDRAGGTEAHREPSDLSRLRRDLAFYLRQAALDERLRLAGALRLHRAD